MSDGGALSLFDPTRLRAYLRTIVIVYAIVSAGFFSGAFGKHLDNDFLAYWSASYLTLKGRASAAFDLQGTIATQQLAVPGSDRVYPWHYPPTYQLLIAPLALLPFWWAYLTFAGLSLLAFVLSLCPLLDGGERALLLLAYPAAFSCFLHGQNSLIAAALFALALQALPQRPWLSGLCFGLLSWKPQLGLLVPLALLAAGQWRAIGGAAIASLGLAGAATAAFGLAQWRSFFAHTQMVRWMMEGGLVPWEKMPTAFVFSRWLGLSQNFSYLIQLAVACIAALAVILAWRRCGPTLLAGGLLVCATLLAWPYVFDYEMAALAVPLCILATEMARTGSVRWERWLLASLFLAPMVTTEIAKLTHVQAGFLDVLGVFLLSCRRLVLAPRAGRPGVRWAAKSQHLSAHREL